MLKIFGLTKDRRVDKGRLEVDRVVIVHHEGQDGVEVGHAVRVHEGHHHQSLRVVVVIVGEGHQGQQLGQGIVRVHVHGIHHQHHFCGIARKTYRFLKIFKFFEN